MRKLPGWMETTQTVSGEWLAQAGLALPILDRKSAILIGFERGMIHDIGAARAAPSSLSL